MFSSSYRGVGCDDRMPPVLTDVSGFVYQFDCRICDNMVSRNLLMKGLS